MQAEKHSTAQLENVSEIKKKLWNGSINVKITLQVPAQQHTIEYLLFIHRNSYFPIVFPDIINYFQNFTSIDLAKIPVWLEYEQVPIKWNLPVGVLYDYLFLPASKQSDCWTLAMRYDQNYPVEHIIPFYEKLPDGEVDYLTTLHQVLTNQLKQSCFVVNGSAKPIMQLSEDNSKQLWQSIVSRNLTTFTSINKKIIKSVDRIPVKIYVAGSPTVVQAPISKTQTLQEILELHIPNMMKLSHPYIQGIDATPLLSESLQEIWKVFRHLDNILYITLIIL
ncbi:Autophagy protein 5 [Candida viswanathii]|uniref:Autophagy protein 5 n=1 Tax=Candida viswanathii TaxID=5486 RepID=A0A367Y5P4_9ASCO|nr:Autophagy protein 5 [Candida viswanathii]